MLIKRKYFILLFVQIFIIALAFIPYCFAMEIYNWESSYSLYFDAFMAIDGGLEYISPFSLFSVLVNFRVIPIPLIPTGVLGYAYIILTLLCLFYFAFHAFGKIEKRVSVSSIFMITAQLLVFVAYSVILCYCGRPYGFGGQFGRRLVFYYAYYPIAMGELFMFFYTLKSFLKSRKLLPYSVPKDIEPEPELVGILGNYDDLKRFKVKFENGEISEEKYIQLKNDILGI